jgi:general secretion pathway protein G
MRKAKRYYSAGFSLIEIMVVVIIIGIMGAIVIPKVINKPDQARIVRAKQDIISIQSALDLYRLDNGRYPSTDQGLQALVSKPSLPPIPQNWHQYLREMPTDPWGTAYHYLSPGQHSDVDIFTYDPTGQPGGTGDKAEIGNWNAKS